MTLVVNVADDKPSIALSIFGGYLSVYWNKDTVTIYKDILLQCT